MFIFYEVTLFYVFNFWQYNMWNVEGHRKHLSLPLLSTMHFLRTPSWSTIQNVEVQEHIHHLPSQPPSLKKEESVSSFPQLHDHLILNSALPTYLFRELSPFLEAANCAVIQKIPRNFKEPEGSSPCSQEPSTVPYLSQFDPVHTIPSYLSKIRFNIVHPPKSCPLPALSI
jgi:hypothetical protein